MRSKASELIESELEVFDQPIELQREAFCAVFYFAVEMLHLLVLNLGSLREKTYVALDLIHDFLCPLCVLLEQINPRVCFFGGEQSFLNLWLEHQVVLLQFFYDCFVALNASAHVVDLMLRVLSFRHGLFQGFWKVGTLLCS